MTLDQRRRLLNALSDSLRTQPATGTIEISISPALNRPPCTLRLDGQEVRRDEYPRLWRWVQDERHLGDGKFTAGDGVDTFCLPDLWGRPTAACVGRVAVEWWIWT